MENQENKMDGSILNSTLKESLSGRCWHGNLCVASVHRTLWRCESVYYNKFE